MFDNIFNIFGYQIIGVHYSVHYHNWKKLPYAVTSQRSVVGPRTKNICFFSHLLSSFQFFKQPYKGDTKYKMVSSVNN